ncbi:MAG: putative molybdenum carrier protein [Candidatus Sumerlaeota bacterium]|nr:putative molybdenum carrier protein [Candidatus Sumerlaeota bacterium]
MFARIISGGQTGVDRAALDAARARGMEYGGWVPKGRLAEDGPLPAIYPMQETPSAEYEERTRLNVRDSDGTLILAKEPLSGGTAYTAYLANRTAKPCLVVDPHSPESLAVARRWVRKNRIRTLNVAGPRASNCPGIYETARVFMLELLK